MARHGRIYVDLDDVLAQTIRGLTALLERRTGRRVAEEDVTHFDLARSFGLAPEELAAFMQHAHRPEELAELAPSPGGAPALEGWVERGYEVFVVTGRPTSTASVSRRWLERHGIPFDGFACIDKYRGRDWAGPGEPALGLDSLPGFGFRLAVEDSLAMAVHLVEDCGVPVALMDRPWNRDLGGVRPETAASLVRCRDWGEVAARFPVP